MNPSSVEEFWMFTLYSGVVLTEGPSELAQAVKLLILFWKYPIRISEEHRPARVFIQANNMMGHDRVLLHSFQFILHCNPIIQRRAYNLSYI